MYVPAAAVSRLQALYMYAQVWDGFALLYSEKRTGSSRTRNWRPTHQTGSFHRSLGRRSGVLLLQATKDTPKQRFGLGWFLPPSTVTASIVAEF